MNQPTPQLRASEIGFCSETGIDGGMEGEGVGAGNETEERTEGTVGVASGSSAAASSLGSPVAGTSGASGPPEGVAPAT